MTVLPVTTIGVVVDAVGQQVGLEVEVGARCREASWLVSRRLTSSGNGCSVVGAQPGLEMDHRHLLVEGRERRREAGRRVALDEHRVGRLDSIQRRASGRKWCAS